MLLLLLSLLVFPLALSLLPPRHSLANSSPTSPHSKATPSLPPRLLFNFLFRFLLSIFYLFFTSFITHFYPLFFHFFARFSSHFLQLIFIVLYYLLALSSPHLISLSLPFSPSFSLLCFFLLPLVFPLAPPRTFFSPYG